ncbi:vegetative cell wall protein gp1-like [Formica exsecta]|uniref:vegetative cell wall protein gp1-like n=1 Tax=Formica exsecta TaxID=72781 RepID=UPI0011441B18|nr:vegetative cell wall protein gp1-like [Formica exsecta]
MLRLPPKYKAAESLYQTPDLQHITTSRKQDGAFSTRPSEVEIISRRRTRPVPLHLTSAKQRKVGAQSPPASGARSPPASGARSPRAHGAQSPPVTCVRSPRKTGAQLPNPPGAQPLHPLSTIDLILGDSPPYARNEQPAPGAPLPLSKQNHLPGSPGTKRKDTKARLQALFGASPPKTSPGRTGSRIRRDRPVIPDIGRPRSTTPPIQWYPPPLISPPRRTPRKESIATQTSPRKIYVDGDANKEAGRKGT